MRSQHLRLLAALAATLAFVVPLGWLWYGSLVPGTYSMAAMGYADLGGGTAGAHHATHGTDISTLRGPATGTPDVDVTLVAARQDVKLADGTVVPDAYTLNGRTPGPPIVAAEGDLVQVTLANGSVPGGVTLHWHGVDLPNAEDGVAGVTQDAVGPGGRHVYRFIAQRPGTYWYHSHQVSDEQVKLGLFGTLVITPRAPAARPDVPPDVEVTAAVHTYRGHRTINGVPGRFPVAAEPGQRVRVRVVNTDDGTLRTWVAGVPYRMVALDGRDWHGPGDVTGEAVRLGAGGRADLEFTVPDDGSPVRVGVGGGTTSLLVAPAAGTAKPPPPEAAPEPNLDLLGYGTPDPQDPATALAAATPDRRFAYSIGRRPGFVDGRPGLWWSVNGHLFPDVPMFHVAEGDVVRMTIENHSGQVHPMHLHGHHVLVLARDGKPATGGPWWTDTLDVADGESYDVAFRADNPGIWADHCHNLLHATQGLTTHLRYEGFSTPFQIGGKAGNTLG